VYLAGQSGRDPHTGKVIEGDIETQTAQSIEIVSACRFSKFRATFSQKDGPIKMLVIILDSYTVKDWTALPSWRLPKCKY
jgi:hypothetical protein